MLKKLRGWLIFALFLLLCAGGIWLMLRVTAVYPALGEPVFYPVNQVEGFELTISEPLWSPFKGYFFEYTVSADSEEVYYIIREPKEPDFAHLERCVDGQWYRLKRMEDYHASLATEIELGGASYGLGASFVQKYDDYGTRLEPGLYRVTLEMRAGDGTPYYLASEFTAK